MNVPIAFRAKLRHENYSHTLKDSLFEFE